MRIGSVGYNYSHDSDFVMDRPNGTGCPLFLLIKTPAVFVINGQEQNVEPGSFVFFTHRTPYSYRARYDEYTDDWIHLDTEDGDRDFFEKLDIPFDRVVYLGVTEELSQIVHTLAYEHYSAGENHGEIEEHYLKILFFKLDRMLKMKAGSHCGVPSEKHYRFTQLRTRIFTMPESIGDVDSMAAEMNMSRSGFQHLYKKIFGVSVMNDVIAGRIDRAKRLLSSTNLTVCEIAEKCGYRNEYNFMNQFRSRMGKTPTEYRKCIGAGVVL